MGLPFPCDFCDESDQEQDKCDLMCSRVPMIATCAQVKNDEPGEQRRVNSAHSSIELHIGPEQQERKRTCQRGSNAANRESSTVANFTEHAQNSECFD